MRTKVLIGTMLLAGALGASTLAAFAPAKQAMALHFLRPTIVAGAAIMGPVVFEHDDEKMARGEPCTTVYRYDHKQQDRGEVIVQFMCTPHERPVATKFEAICDRGAGTGPDRLLEYQFPGETEGHGVPQ